MLREPAVDPETLLYTDKAGTRVQLQDVIDDGLDEDYSGRFAALLKLMREGTPRHRLHACVMLASWGVPDGLRTLIEWARDPGSTPWAKSPVSVDRQYGVDDSFVLLADAIRAAGELDKDATLDAVRADATRALLGIYHRVYFGRSLQVALDLDRGLTASVRAVLPAAVDRAITAARSSKLAFDMAVQAASLVAPLAILDDVHAARAAESLITDHPTNERALREVAYALRWGTGPATRAVLDRLVTSTMTAVVADARESVALRKAS